MKLHCLNDNIPVWRGVNKWLNVWKGRRGGSCLCDATLYRLTMDPLLPSSVCLANSWKIRRTWYRPTLPVSCLNLWPMICWGCRDLDVMLLLLILLPPSSFVESSVVGVVGGSESILLERQRESPVLAAAEIVGCPDGHLPLPDYPRQDPSSCHLFNWTIFSSGQILDNEMVNSEYPWTMEHLRMVFQWFPQIRGQHGSIDRLKRNMSTNSNNGIALSHHFATIGSNGVWLPPSCLDGYNPTIRLKLETGIPKEYFLLLLVRQELFASWCAKDLASDTF